MDDLPSGLVLPPGVRAEDVWVREPAAPPESARWRQLRREVAAGGRMLSLAYRSKRGELEMSRAAVALAERLGGPRV